MTAQEVQALADAAAGLVLYHNGLWGAPTCYMWAGPDGTAAGRVPPWECEALDRLGWRKLIVTAPGSGPEDGLVQPTEAGLATLHAQQARAA
ncbi:hypothetical protein HNR02_004370 [Amycolatopsis endophytica]|uniref:Uncharacterized protein n=1 Tax=Amycolatopsis endophytica TaxID=860233 RepID=A0A853B8G6_9PSEU|nr:hypothetical protein [Amycolatopsis endophytica]NYI91047.1 hypothetical protein [Amycolatopsis endophytica]